MLPLTPAETGLAQLNDTHQEWLCVRGKSRLLREVGRVRTSERWSLVGVDLCICHHDAILESGESKCKVIFDILVRGGDVWKLAVFCTSLTNDPWNSGNAF